MKIKTITRSEEAMTRSNKHDVTKVHRNLDPKLHPFEKAREVNTNTLLSPSPLQLTSTLAVHPGIECH